MKSKANLLTGEPAGIEAIYVMKSVEDWDRFMRFMNRYAEQNGLGFYQELETATTP